MASQVSGAPTSMAVVLHTTLTDQYLTKLSDITNAYLKADAMRKHVDKRYNRLTIRTAKIPSPDQLIDERATYYATYRKLRDVYKQSEALQKAMVHGYKFLEADSVAMVTDTQPTPQQIQSLKEYALNFEKTREQLDDGLAQLKRNSLYFFHLLVQNKGKGLSFCQILRSTCSCPPLPKVDKMIKRGDSALIDPIESIEVEPFLLTSEDEKEHKAQGHVKEDNSSTPSSEEPIDSLIAWKKTNVPSTLRFRKKAQKQPPPALIRKPSLKSVRFEDLEPASYKKESSMAEQLNTILLQNGTRERIEEMDIGEEVWKINRQLKLRCKDLQSRKVAIASLDALSDERDAYYLVYIKLNGIYNRATTLESFLRYGYKLLKYLHIQEISVDQLRKLEGQHKTIERIESILFDQLKTLKALFLYFHLIVENRGRPLNLCQRLQPSFHAFPDLREQVKGREESLKAKVEAIEIQADYKPTFHQQRKVDQKERNLLVKN